MRAWLSGQPIASVLPPADQPLLEVIPLNSEQQQAVRQALSSPLTVITGPPGTGKSQVVTSILVNAAWRNKSVLFASKNNKAVDVVETRVNALGSRPMLLRLGPNEYQSRLATYLASILAATSTPDDHARYREHEEIHGRLMQSSNVLDVELQTLIALRNEVDQLEQKVEPIRRDMTNEVFQRSRAVDARSMNNAVGTLQTSIDASNQAKQSFWTRLVWPFVRGHKFDQLANAAAGFAEMAQDMGLPLPKSTPDLVSVNEWIDYGSQLATRLHQVSAAQSYSAKLATLTSARSFETIAAARKSLTDEVSQNSESLWNAWLRLQPSRMSATQRRLLGDYVALLLMIIGANSQNRRVESNVYRRYQNLFPQIMTTLPCWAVTSLSARSHVPFEPKFFDLLVIDEASQCDIASALPLLYRARSVVIIGDPMQLRHISTLSRAQDQQLLSKHGLVDDFAGWAYSTRSLFDLASSLCRSEDIVALRDHHRSHADIIEFSNKLFYEGRLRVATRYDRLRFPHRDHPAVRWVDTRGKTFRPPDGGAVNEEEAKAVVKEIERLINQGYRGSIGVISPFRAQANRIRDLVHNHGDLITRVANADFLADTVHKFQGDERDVMIFSPVISSGVSDGALSFLRSNPNLFNVAVTRARAALIVVGDRVAALNCNVDYLARFAAYSDQIAHRVQRIEITPNMDFGPEYPAVPDPSKVSDWERYFYKVLYARGFRPIPQYSVEKYDLDFALIAGERRLNIEVDGEHHRNWDGEICRRDQIQ